MAEEFGAEIASEQVAVTVRIGHCRGFGCGQRSGKHRVDAVLEVLCVDAACSHLLNAQPLFHGAEDFSVSHSVGPEVPFDLVQQLRTQCADRVFRQFDNLCGRGDWCEIRLCNGAVTHRVVHLDGVAGSQCGH